MFRDARRALRKGRRTDRPPNIGFYPSLSATAGLESQKLLSERIRVLPEHLATQLILLFYSAVKHFLKKLLPRPFRSRANRFSLLYEHHATRSASCSSASSNATKSETSYNLSTAPAS